MQLIPPLQEEPEEPKEPNRLMVDVLEAGYDPVKLNEGNEASNQPARFQQPIPLQQLQQNQPLEWAERPAMPSNASKISGKRRFSTAGGLLFSVNENVPETGSDYLPKIVNNSNIIAQPTVPAQLEIQNEFDPFQRLESPPFLMHGRKRSASQIMRIKTFCSESCKAHTGNYECEKLAPCENG